MLKTVRSTVNVDQITGVLPVVNGGTGVKTSTGTDNVVLSAAPTLSGDVALSTGNLVLSTSGKGIDFSATPGTGTSELLADYEEGTWTPNDQSGAALGISTINATYTRIGRQVTARTQIEYPATVDVSQAKIGGLPFTVSKTTVGSSISGAAAAVIPNLIDGTTFMFIRSTGDTTVTNAQLSLVNIFITATYFV